MIWTTVGKIMALAPTHDMKVKDELERLLKEYGKLKEPWEFVSR